MDRVISYTIEALLKSDHALTAKEVASSINVSESTIKHNMKQLKYIIESVGGHIDSIPGKGFVLQATEDQRKSLLQMISSKDNSDSFYYRRKYILDILFKKNSNYTIQIFADDLNVSRKVILEDLESIEKWLAYFNVKLIRVRNLGIQVEGNEYSIREAIMDSNKQLMETMVSDLDLPDRYDIRISKSFYNYFSKFYSDCDLDLIEELLLEVEHYLNIHFEDTSFIQLVEYIALMNRRIQDGNVIILKNILTKYKCDQREYDASKFLIEKLLKNQTGFLTMEIHCLGVQFVLYGCYDQACHNLYEEEYYTDVTLTLLKNIQQTAKIEMPINDKIIKDISNLFMKKRISEGYQPIPNKYLINDIRSNLSSIYGIVLANVRIIEDCFKFIITDSDLAYITMLIDNERVKRDERVNAALVTSFDRNIATYLKNKIEKNVEDVFISKIIEFDRYEDSKKKGYDIIFTTVLSEDEDLVKISRRVDQKDLQIISTEVRKCMEKKKATVFKENITSESLILTNYRAKKKEDVLKKACQLLGQHGCVEEGFLETLLDKENIVSTSIGNGVAMPHGFKKCIKKSGIAIIKLKNPVDWTENEKVDLVFVFAINSSNRREVMDIFAKFYEIISDEKTLERIKESETPRKLYSYVRNIGRYES